jgi:tellurite methyltransferase
MSQEERLKWDERYRTGAYTDRTHATALLAEWLPQLARGRALDVACGAGRNSLYLAANGWQVDAVDISPVGLERARQSAAAQGVEVCWIQADLEGDPGTVLPTGPYDLIVLVRYVNPAIYPHLLERLARGGVLLCEQHVVSSADVIGPKNPTYRLRENELLLAFTAAGESDYRVLYYREGCVTDPDGRNAALAQLVLRREGTNSGVGTQSAPGNV